MLAWAQRVKVVATIAPQRSDPGPMNALSQALPTDPERGRLACQLQAQITGKMVAVHLKKMILVAFVALTHALHKLLHLLRAQVRFSLHPCVGHAPRRQGRGSIHPPRMGQYSPAKDHAKDARIAVGTPHHCTKNTTHAG